MCRLENPYDWLSLLKNTQISLFTLDDSKFFLILKKGIGIEGEKNIETS